LDKNGRNNDGSTPLYIAATEGHVLLVSKLLEMGADKNIAGGCTVYLVGCHLPKNATTFAEIKSLLE